MDPNDGFRVLVFHVKPFQNVYFDIRVFEFVCSNENKFSLSENQIINWQCVFHNYAYIKPKNYLSCVR